MPIVHAKATDWKQITIKALHIIQPITMRFASIITEFSDSWTPRWSTTNVHGRMDPLAFYGGASRELTLGFRVISDDKYEASKNMFSLQKLIQYQYPSYRELADSVGAGGQKPKVLQSAPFFSIQFLNAVGGGTAASGGSQLLGFFNSAIQINPGFQNKEVAQYFSDDNNLLYFSDVNVVLKMQVLHEKLIGFKASGAGVWEGPTNYPYGIERLTAPSSSPDVGDVSDAADPPIGNNTNDNPEVPVGGGNAQYASAPALNKVGKDHSMATLEELRDFADILKSTNPTEVA